MNLLVTGASGFLGRNFLLRASGAYRQILAVYRNDTGFPAFVASCNDPRIVPVACDLADPAQVIRLFADYGPEWDACLYLAAKVDIPWSVREPTMDLLANVTSMLNLLEPLRAARLVYFSSGAVYDGLSGEAGPRASLNPTLPYAISKLTAERYVQFYRDRRKTIGESLIVRFFGAYGPYEAPHKIYTRLVRAFAQGDSYTIYGDGTNLIDAMYVDDAVDAINLMLEGRHWNDTVNLAGGCPVTIETLVQQTGTALGIPKVHIQKEGVANERNEFWGSVAEMHEFYGFTPKIQLADGIVRLREFLQRQSRAAGGSS